MPIEIKDIVLAEDDRSTAYLVKTRLERAGFKVVLANNGREALGLIHARKVDLLITDVVMPEMDGVDLYIELKKNKKTASLPVLIVTDKKMFQESFASMGADHFIPKSSDIDSLIAKIHEIANLKQETKQYRKVLIGGDHSVSVAQMSVLLKQHACIVSVTDKPVYIVSDALVMVPHIILLDLILPGNMIVQEVIRSLRCYSLLRTIPILLYIHILPEEFGFAQNAQELLEDHIKTSLDAGANEYIGRFNQVTFISNLKGYGVSQSVM